MEHVNTSNLDSSAASATNTEFCVKKKTFLLTYPKCPATKESLRDLCLSVFERYDPIYIIVSSEKHQDGSPHLHALVHLKDKPMMRNAHRRLILENLYVPHINPQTFGTAKKMRDYVAKQGDFLEHGSLPSCPEKVSTRMARCAKAQVTWRNLMENEELMGYALVHKKQYEEALEALKPIPTLPPWTKPTVNCEAIQSWLIGNIGVKRTLRQKQLWIYGRPGIGKTYLLQELQTRLNPYFLPVHSMWFDAYNDNDYDIIICDEFLNGLPYTLMNQLLDGQTVGLKRRGKPEYIKRNNLPVIICSNYYPGDCYTNIFEKNAMARQSFEDRFVVAQPQELITITFE